MAGGYMSIDDLESVKKVRYIYDDRSKSDEEIIITKVIASHGNYEFVLLENGEVGMIKEKMYISDKRDFYLVAEKHKE